MRRRLSLLVLLVFVAMSLLEAEEGSISEENTVEVVLLTSHGGNHHHSAEWARGIRRALERAGYAVVLRERLIANDDGAAHFSRGKLIS